MTLRRKFQTYIIPSIEKEIKAEEKHLAELNELTKKYPSAEVFIKSSMSALNDLKLRLHKYQEFAFDINKN